MPKSRWNVDVYVYLLNAGPPVQHHIETCLPVDPADSQRIVFHNRGRPGFKINFHLIDQTGGGYRFPKNAAKLDAVWSRRGNVCPNAAVHEVFKPLQVKQNGEILVVTNANPPPAPGLGRFKYTLNVSSTGDPPYLAIDPGGDDQNGPQK